MAKIITNGTPGTTWTNTTGKVQYQLLVTWENSCGLCIQYDRAIGPLWPTPFHRGCRCRQKPVWAGNESDPFVDFRKKLLDLDPGQQARVIGRSNLKLVEAGVVKWSDVVTPARIRSLREVVSRGKLSVAELLDAGVTKKAAEAAHQSVNTPAHAVAEAERVEALRKLLGLGVSKPQIKELFGARVAERVGISEGPSGPQPMPPAPSVPFLPTLLLSIGVKPEAVAEAERVAARKRKEQSE